MKIKIVLFIVEGPSDETALAPYLTKFIEKNKKKLSIQITHGDKTGELLYNSDEFTVTPTNITQYLENLVIKYLKTKEIKDLGIKAKNIEKVYYITDTDNCFFEKSSPRVNKRKCLSKIFNFKTLEIYQTEEVRKQEKKKIESERNVKRADFKTIFFAKDLEAVTINNTKILTDKEKERIAIDFAKKSLQNETFFENIFRDKDLKIWENYVASYEGIKSYKKRASNMNNLLDEIKNWVL